MADTDIVDRLLMSLQVNPPHPLRNADIAEAANEIRRLRVSVNGMAAILKAAADAVDYHRLGYGNGDFDANTMLALMDRLGALLDANHSPSLRTLTP